MSLAVLAMYDWPELQGANDQIWSGVATRLRAAGMTAPDKLNRSLDEEVPWRSPELLLAQTCGYPYVKSLRGKVRLVGTPHYDAEGCSGPEYCSWILVRQGSDIRNMAGLRQRRAAVNHYRSHSGWNALRSTIPGVLNDVLLTGSHLESLRMVAEGQADFCATDSVCWALARHHRPDLAAHLRIVGQSQSVPGLPYITAAGRSDEELQILRRAISETIHDVDMDSAREVLLLDDFSVVEDEDYDIVLAMEQQGGS